MGRRTAAATLGALLLCVWSTVPVGAVSDAARDSAAAEARATAAEEAKVLEQRLETDSENAELWLQFGHALFRAGDLKRAEDAFVRAEVTAEGRDDMLAEAYNGQGLVCAARGNQLQAAVGFFKRALREKRNDPEIHTNMALAYYKYNWLSHAIREAKKAVAADSTYAPAVTLLDRCRAAKSEDREHAKTAFEEYLESQPQDYVGWLEWGKLALADGENGEILEQLMPIARMNPTWYELYPIVGQAYWKKGYPDNAWSIFSAYLAGVDDEERARYRDLALVAPRDVVAEYAKASEEERKELSDRFWGDRDPDHTTEVNERLLEHYRRVWYARTFLSKHKEPWDRRGEIYIRYGEPDHRSRSSSPTPPPTHSAATVKQRQFDMIYSDQHMFLAMGGGSEIPYLDPLDPPEGGAPEDVDWDAIREFGTGTMTGVQWFDAVTGGRTGALVGPVWPVRATDPRAETGIYLPVGSTDHSLVKWESWVYTKVAGGIVIDFTDEIGKGGFDYAPIPEMGKTPGLRHSSEDGLDDMRAFAAFTYHAPLAIARRAHAAMPELYEIAPQDRPFDFYFDEARFRGGDPSGARVEVYFGVPMSAAVYLEDRDSTGLRAECRVALAAEDGEGILRSADELIYLDEGDRTGGDGIIPHLTVLDVPPGEYTVDVRMRNLHNSEIGVYRKRLEVEAYPAGSLMLSDIQLAWDVTEGGLPGKFTKNGLQVVPMPTRLYRHGESVYVYYEIYNLSRDEFGMTNYTVEYTVRSGKPPGSIQRILRAFKGGGSEEQVSVAAQEQLGVSETEPNYIELDLSAAEPGEVVLTVTVKDLVSGEEVAEEARFELAEREER